MRRRWTTAVLLCLFFAPRFALTDASKLLFYNAQTREGAVAVLSDSQPQTPAPGTFGGRNLDDIKTVRVYRQGELMANWPQVVAAGSDILFYNTVNSTAIIGKLVPPNTPAGASSFQTVTTYAASAFAPGWTHVAAVGEIANDPSTTAKTFPSGAFAKGWTHIASAHEEIFR